MLTSSLSESFGAGPGRFKACWITVDPFIVSSTMVKMVVRTVALSSIGSALLVCLDVYKRKRTIVLPPCQLLAQSVNVLTITIPSLRERADDLPLLVQHFLQRQSRSLGRAFTMTSEAMVTLQHYSWPGNVRELENMLERVTYLMPKTTITVDDLP